MEPIETDFDYVAKQSQNPRSRFNWLYIIPTLGLVWLVFLVASAFFQWQITSIVNPVMVFMLVVFFSLVALLFYAMAPRSNRE
jgi:4-amino-4-deoxy-L-arabinose transferase-like glycosyltransferase